MKCSSNMTCLGGRFMKSKKMLKRMIAAALSTAVMLTAVAPVTNAQTVEKTDEETLGISQASVSRGMIAAPTGKYYCISTGREDSWINVASGGTACSFNNVYSSDAGGYVTGTGSHTRTTTNKDSFQFYLNSWHYHNQSTHYNYTITISVQIIGADYVLANGEIYVKR